MPDAKNEEHRMKRSIKWIILSGLAVIAITLAACTRTATPTGVPTEPNPASPATPSPSPEPQPAAPGDALGDILGRAKNITSMKYEARITGPGAPEMTQTLWMKNSKMRTEAIQEGETMVALIDRDTRAMYMYLPDQNIAMKITYQATQSAADEAGSITDYSPEVIGHEAVDGKPCVVVQYVIEGTTAKAWLWEEWGIPIRMEMTKDGATTTIEYTNIDFGDIADSMFELPPGVQIVETGA
jgi:hypothetical protein